jgi:hypothetical protein
VIISAVFDHADSTDRNAVDGWWNRMTEAGYTA